MFIKYVFTFHITSFNQLFSKLNDKEDGAWLVEYRKEQKHFGGVLRPREATSEPTKSETNSVVVEKIRLSDLTDSSDLSRLTDNASDRSGLLDGFYLVLHLNI